jgi:hypothetical protein
MKKMKKLADTLGGSVFSVVSWLELQISETGRR